MAIKPPVPFLPRCTLSVWPKIIPTLLRNLQRGKYLSFLRLPGPCGDCLQPGTERHPCPQKVPTPGVAPGQGQSIWFWGKECEASLSRKVQVFYCTFMMASAKRHMAESLSIWPGIVRKANHWWSGPLEDKGDADEVTEEWAVTETGGLEGGFQAREPDTHTAWPSSLL